MSEFFVWAAVVVTKALSSWVRNVSLCFCSLIYLLLCRDRRAARTAFAFRNPKTSTTAGAIFSALWARKNSDLVLCLLELFIDGARYSRFVNCIANRRSSSFVFAKPVVEGAKLLVQFGAE